MLIFIRMELSVIVPTLANHGNFIRSCESIAANIPPDAEFFLAYNGEAAGFGELKDRLKHLPRVRVIQTTEYGGISKACNEAFKISSGAFVAILHDDVILNDPDWYPKLKRVLETRPDVGMVGGSEAKYIDRSPGEIPPLDASGAPRECDWSPTISLVRKATLEDGCLFDEYYLVGLEDKDWALGFRRKNLKVAFYPVLHEHIGCQGSYSLFTKKISFLDYYSREGRRERYFLEKNKDILKPSYYEASLRKWGGRERDWRKKWWKALYVKHYAARLAEFLRALFR